MAHALGNRGQYEDFLTWHAGKSLRRRGQALSPSTLVAKRYRLQAVATELGADSPMQLAAVVGDRSRGRSTVHKLYLTKAPSTVNSIAVAAPALRGVRGRAGAGLYACYVRAEDAPSKVGRLKAVEVFTAAEVERILLFAQARNGLRFWALLSTLEQTGMRISEALGLRWGDLALDAESGDVAALHRLGVRVESNGTPPNLRLAHTKNGKPAFVPLTSKLRTEVFTAEHIAKMQAKGHPLWGKDIVEWVFPYQYVSAVARFRSVCEAAEVPWRNGFHVWRHTFAVRKLTSGVPIHIVSRWLNHSNISITDRYYYSHTTSLSFGEWVD